MPETPPFSPTIALLTVVAAWEKEFANALKPLGLTSRRYALLGHIRSMPGISFSELGRRSRISTPTAHVAVASLKDDGLVEDGTERAGAASQLRVTAEGSRLLDEASVRIRDLDARFTAAHPALTEALRLHVEGIIGGGR